MEYCTKSGSETENADSEMESEERVVSGDMEEEEKEKSVEEEDSSPERGEETEETEAEEIWLSKNGIRWSTSHAKTLPRWSPVWICFLRKTSWT